MQFNIVGPSYLSRSRFFDAERTINLYAEKSESGESKDVAMLVGTPGLILFATLAGGNVRGMIRFSATQAIIVVGGNVYSVTIAGIGTLIGVINNRTTPVVMDTNGKIIMMACGPEGYFVDPTLATVTPIISSAFLGADRVNFIDGYFIFNQPGTQKFQITKLYSSVIDPLQIASAEGSPDLLVSLLVAHRDVWLFGENSTEIFFNSGADFPFQRIQGAFLEEGCAAKYSPAKMDNSVFWLSKSDRGKGIVMRANGYAPQRISTHAIEFAIAQYSDISDAIGYTYQQEGHSFYVLTFPTGNATWVYDAATQLWHERSWRNPIDASMNRHRSNCQMTFGDKTLVGDFQNGNIYQMDLNTFTDNGDILPAIRQAAHEADESNHFIFYHKFWLDMEVGIGLNSGLDPQVVLDWSNDGGASFLMSRQVSAGKIGERMVRAIFRRLGRARDRVWRITVTDPVKRIFIKSDIEATLGTA